MKQEFDVYTDCFFFPLDRPCACQKNENAHCFNCPRYQKITNKNQKPSILIVKLGAMGDVLRTTFILEGLKELHPQSEISWIVSKNNSQVLKNNPLIDKIIINDEKAPLFLCENFFDIVINLDLAPESLALAKLSNSAKIYGYTLDNSRTVLPSNDAAKEWLSMSAYDELKRKNTNTYQHWMSKITEIPKDNYEINVALDKSSLRKSEKFLADTLKPNGKKIIGINPGAGKRWKLKKWTSSGFIETAKHFSKKGHIVLLLGGYDDEQEIENILREKIPNVFSAGTDNSVADFFAMINLCDIVLTGDTMALHAALGLRKNVVALFGPTSAAEIEMYLRGTKIYSDKKCLCCYRQDCPEQETCMDLIKPITVIKTMEGYL